MCESVLIKKIHQTNGLDLLILSHVYSADILKVHALNSVCDRIGDIMTDPTAKEKLDGHPDLQTDIFSFTALKFKIFTDTSVTSNSKM